jgi:hypothetical protein
LSKSWRADRHFASTPDHNLDHVDPAKHLANSLADLSLDGRYWTMPLLGSSVHWNRVSI